MSAIARYQKTPVERKRYTIDYSAWLDEDETLTFVTFDVEPQDANPIQIDAFEIMDDQVTVQYYVSEGVHNTQYIVDVQITTSAGQKKEDLIEITIVDPTL